MDTVSKRNSIIFWSALVTLSVIALLVFTLSLAEDGIDSNESVYGLGSGYSSPSGGGGGGVVVVVPPSSDTSVDPPPPVLTVEVVSQDITGKIDADGVMTQSVTVASPDGNAAVTVPAGTTARDVNGNTLTQISYQKAAPVPVPVGMSIMVAANFGPDGATFDPPATVTMTYDPATLPEGVAQESLVLAYFDTVASRWVNLTGIVVDTVNHTVSGAASHFTKFAVMVAAETVTAVTPVETPTVVPAVDPTAEPVSTPVSDEFKPLASTSDDDSEGGISYWLIIVPVIAVITIGLASYYTFKRRKA